MSDWTMQPRNSLEERLHIAGYRITYNYACMYTAFPPPETKAPPSGWVYYGKSIDDAWTAAYKHDQRRGDVPNGLLDILNAMVELYEHDGYPSIEFSNRLIELRDWLKKENYR